MVSHSCNPRTPEEDQEFKVALNYIKPCLKGNRKVEKRRENKQTKKNRGPPGLQLNTKSPESTHF